MITRVNPYFPAINKGVAHRGLVTPGFPNTTGAWLWFSDTQRVISADDEKRGGWLQLVQVTPRLPRRLQVQVVGIDTFVCTPAAAGEKEPELIPVHDQLQRTPVY